MRRIINSLAWVIALVLLSTTAWAQMPVPVAVPVPAPAPAPGAGAGWFGAYGNLYGPRVVVSRPYAGVRYGPRYAGYRYGYRRGFNRGLRPYRGRFGYRR